MKINTPLCLCSLDNMPLPPLLLVALLCLSQPLGVQTLVRLLDDVELRSAFSAARTNSMEGGPKMTVTFDVVYVNIGEDFDAKAGLFRCRISGAYYFSFTVGKFPHKDLSVMLMKNRNEVQAIVYEENAGEERKVGSYAVSQVFVLSPKSPKISTLCHVYLSFLIKLINLTCLRIYMYSQSSQLVSLSV